MRQLFSSRLTWPRWVAFLSGYAHITLPNGTEEAHIRGGKHGLILAVDTAAVSKHGHITNYPSDEETVTLQIPTNNGTIPAHKKLYSGACKREELRDL